ncbi:MAG TPA: hypothetical protein VKF59_05600 [Candidatus Dormibacteraeota bacterium]|nr:hypothetical protein [Candidatus Dormibacteraeota bacterium]
MDPAAPEHDERVHEEEVRYVPLKRRLWLLAVPAIGAAGVGVGLALSGPVLAATPSPTPASGSTAGPSTGSGSSPSPANHTCPNRQ